MDFEILYILCIFIGILSGMASGIFGLGGGIVIVPVLMTFGLSSHTAVAMSALQMIFASSFGSYINYKKKNLDIRDGIFVGLGGLFGGSFSGELIKLLSDTSLNALFLCVNIIFFVKFIFSFKTEARHSQRSEGFKKFILFVKESIMVNSISGKTIFKGIAGNPAPEPTSQTFKPLKFLLKAIVNES